MGEISGQLSVDRSEIDHFDSTIDVLVVGFGAAGTAAAIAAREQGASVLALERTGGAGGAAALAEGIIYLGGGTPVQRACGFEDSVENMTAYLMADFSMRRTLRRSASLAFMASLI